MIIANKEERLYAVCDHCILKQLFNCFFTESLGFFMLCRRLLIEKAGPAASGNAIYCNLENSITELQKM